MELDEGTYTVLAYGEGVTPGEIASRHGGMPVGDGALAFRGATQAVRCAVEIEEATAVPIGLHAGEIAPGEGSAARVVVLVSRLAMLARAGQVLASRTSTARPSRSRSPLTAYYVATEALTNVAKHAHARRARLELTTGAGGLLVRVGDDGVGGADLVGGGLRGLRDRVAAVNGELRVLSPRGRGTVVEARLPLGARTR